MRKWSLAVLAAVALCALAATGQGDIIKVEYDANVGPSPNPTTVDAYVSEPGFQPWVGYGGGAYTDIDDGIPTWWLYGSNYSGSYQRDSLTAADAAAGDAYGWSLTCRVRIPGPQPDAVAGDFGCLVGYIDGTHDWYMDFGCDPADNDPIVALINYPSAATTYTVQGGAPNPVDGSGGFHVYELRYDPLSGTADLFVDDVEVISDWGGATFYLPTPRVAWGNYSDTYGGWIHVNYIRWSVVPEPATIAIMALGTGGLLLLRKRRR